MKDRPMTSILKGKARGVFTALLLAGALSACGGIGGKKEPATPTVGKRVPILSRIAVEVKPDAALDGVAVVLPAAQPNANWPQVGGNAAKSMGHMAFSASPQQAWTAKIPGAGGGRRLAAAPVVDNGMLFAVGTDGAVYAFDAATGAARWTHTVDVDRSLQSTLFGGGVSADNGRVYATSGSGDVVALDAATGNQIWRVKPAGPLRGAPTVAFNSLYVMTQDNQIHALNINTGALVWQDAASAGQAGVYGVAAPAAGQGTVIAGFSSGELVAYRYENGRNLWSDALARTSISTQVGTLTDVDADPIIDNGRVYALGQGGRMAAYDLLSGQRLWELNLAGISTPAVAGDWVFTLTDDARLLAIARNTGKVKWVTQMEQWSKPKSKEGPIFWQGPVLADNKLWAANSQGDVVTVDVATGVAAPFTQLKESVSLPPILANRSLYILDDSGRITAWR